MANLRIGRRSGLVRRGGRMVRETAWVGVTEVNIVLSGANSSAIQNSASASLLNLRPFTVVRSRIEWFCKSDQTVGLERYQAALGFAVVSDQALAIGVTAVPTPFNDIHSDLWFMHEIIAGSFTFVSGVGFEPVGGIYKSIDSRAMRKVEDGQDIALVIENSGISLGTDNMTAGRLLIKLH